MRVCVCVWTHPRDRAFSDPVKVAGGVHRVDLGQSRCQAPLCQGLQLRVVQRDSCKDKGAAKSQSQASTYEVNGERERHSPEHPRDCSRAKRSTCDFIPTSTRAKLRSSSSSSLLTCVPEGPRVPPLTLGHPLKTPSPLVSLASFTQQTLTFVQLY